MAGKRDDDVHLFPRNGVRDYTIDDPEVEYSGETKNGKPHGKGKLIEINTGKLLYFGDWKDGKRHGKGKEITVQRFDAIYEGDFVEDRWEGKGVRYYLGRRTEGDFVNNQPNGKIIATCIRDKWMDYEGDIVEDRYTGYGKLYHRGKLRYEGEILREAFNGYGTEYLPDGFQYTGQFTMGRITGRGELYKIINGKKKIFVKGEFRVIYDDKARNHFVYGWDDSRKIDLKNLETQMPDVTFDHVFGEYEFNFMDEEETLD